MKKIIGIIIFILLIVLFLIGCFYWYPKNKKSYNAKDFNIQIVESENDYNYCLEQLEKNRELR